MPKRRVKSHAISGKYFVWNIYQRSNGVYYADGRSNDFPLGRHSLAARDFETAKKAVHDLDLSIAIEQGIAPRELAPLQGAGLLSVAAGIEMYLTHLTRPLSAGGIRKSSVRRYKIAFRNFNTFVESQGVKSWGAVTNDLIRRYDEELNKNYAEKTKYLILTTIKSCVRWLIQERRLPEDRQIRYRLRPPVSTETYCWSEAEVAAMLAHCDSDARRWLRDVILGLAHTGMRISELVGLRWSDVDLDAKVISLTDESRRPGRHRGKAARTTKSGRGRSIPIQQELLTRLQAIPRVGNDAVFRGVSGQPLTPKKVRDQFIREVITPLASRFPATPDGGRGFADGRLHSFRHFFCSRCANQGVSEPVLMAWLGHRDRSMTAHYYHLKDDESRRQIDRLSPLAVGNGAHGE